ncbi:RIIB lysis inhibitor [Escherichia phage EcS1]|uniref:Protector from prophage-induced early lysis n=1 Tax=Escherichia phage EcS1 TaxID=2083276 RepID=A0A2Z5ZDH2_9CAUD|nr:RIIB lysis inhibitor [Escherichia phage EcS1]BBC78343.1 Protector from prophage-induced early lysis [Escherichia phage EcS1]
MAVSILSKTEKAKIVKTFKSGLKNKSELARDYGVSPDTIRRVIKEVEPTLTKVEIKSGKTLIKEALTKAASTTVYLNGSVDITKLKNHLATRAPEFIWNANSKFISISQGRETWNADKDHPNFKQALQKLVDGDIQAALDLINVERAVKAFVKGNVKIEDGELTYKDLAIDSGLTKRILTLMEEGKEFTFLLPFLENLMLNPSRKAVYRLYDFLEANDIQITADGYFIAWKKVAEDYKDIYTGKMDNSPGKTLSVPRNQVDEDDNRTCSHGLHVCSKSYLGSYGGCANNKVVSVKVHPRDVVSIPIDYHNAKMRTTGYLVLEDKTEAFKAGSL